MARLNVRFFGGGGEGWTTPPTPIRTPSPSLFLEMSVCPLFSPIFFPMRRLTPSPRDQCVVVVPIPVSMPML